jgi:hypothetical protein
VILEAFLAAQAKRHPRLGGLLTRVARRAFPENVIVLNYPVDAKPRWSQETPNRLLYEIIDLERSEYAKRLHSFLAFVENLVEIAERPENASPMEPSWINGWMPALDGVSLYCLLALHKPNYYVEVGSGNSTKFARRAIADHGLPTQIISIDPRPRAEVNEICDQVIRRPVECVEPDLFDMLGRNDILYIDNSHRVFMNSDVTTLFLDVIPRLKPGVLVEVHDVFLPYDYPAAWSERYYSEQYLLAAYLLAHGHTFDIVLPNTFISDDPELRTVLSPLWATERMRNVERYGCSFWARTKGTL